jgi:hypothetical protein
LNRFPEDQISNLKPGWLTRCLYRPEEFFPEESQAVCRIAHRASTDKILALELRAALDQEKFVPKVEELMPDWIERWSEDCAYALALYCRVMDCLWEPMDPVWSALNERPLEPHELDLALRFLEVNPYVHQTGYAKEFLIKRLKGQNFSKKDIVRMERLLRDQVLRRGHRKLPGWRKLARLLPDEVVLKIISEAIEHEDPLVRRAGNYLRTWKGGVKRS